jgi:hypothetical protein
VDGVEEVDGGELRTVEVGRQHGLVRAVSEQCDGQYQREQDSRRYGQQTSEDDHRRLPARSAVPQNHRAVRGCDQ